jgi:hypothetical protein
MVPGRARKSESWVTKDYYQGVIKLIQRRHGLASGLLDIQGYHALPQIVSMMGVIVTGSRSSHVSSLAGFFMFIRRLGEAGNLVVAGRMLHTPAHLAKHGRRVCALPHCQLELPQYYLGQSDRKEIRTLSPAINKNDKVFQNCII